MKRLVTLTRALVTDPEVVLLDESTAGYDQGHDDILIKEFLAKAESKDSWYYEFEAN
jgi:ABC-type molybdenum transport system ATPase subunit/photorepair protein PhrA